MMLRAPLQLDVIITNNTWSWNYDTEQKYQEEEPAYHPCQGGCEAED